MTHPSDTATGETHMTSRFFVERITRNGVLVGFGVYDCVNGMRSEHKRFMMNERSHEDAKRLAEKYARIANNQIQAAPPTLAQGEG